MSLRERLAARRGEDTKDPSEELYEAFGLRRNPFPSAGQPSGHLCVVSSSPLQDIAHDDGAWYYLGEMSWYDHEEVMAKISAEVPGVLFHLRGSGESTEDLWDLYAEGGRVQKHAATVVRVLEPEAAAWKVLLTSRPVRVAK